MNRSASSSLPPLWPPPAETVASAIFAAVMSGEVDPTEIDAVEGLPPSKFPKELMVKLGFSPPPEIGVADGAPSSHMEESVAAAWQKLEEQGYPKEDHDPGNNETLSPRSATFDALVEVVASGTLHVVAYNYDTCPVDGEEIVVYDVVRVDVSDACGPGAPRLLRRLEVKSDGGGLGPLCAPPEPPWNGAVKEVGCYARIRRTRQVDASREIPVSITGDGVKVGDSLVTWSELAEGGGKDQHGCFTAYWHGKPLGLPLTKELYVGGVRRGGERRKMLVALLEQVDFMVTYGAADSFGGSAAWVVEAAGENPDVLLDLALSLPWARARQLQGPPELTLWLMDSHAQSPRRVIRG